MCVLAARSCSSLPRRSRVSHVACAESLRAAPGRGGLAGGAARVVRQQEGCFASQNPRGFEAVRCLFLPFPSQKHCLGILRRQPQGCGPACRQPDAPSCNGRNRIDGSPPLPVEAGSWKHREVVQVVSPGRTK